MNILIDILPEEYEGLKVNTNFRSFILFELLMQDNNLSEEEKVMLTLKIFYKEEIKDIKKAMQAVLWFYSQGKSEEIKKENIVKKEEKKKPKRIYSFEHDANLIFSAFKHDYGIDLNEIEYLHWWKFKTLFECLNEENTICKYMQYRAIDLSQIKDKDEKKRYKKLKQQCALPDNRTEEEKEQEFADAFW